MCTTINTTLLIAGLLLTGQACAGETEQTVNADPHGTVEISNVSGQVRVAGWDRSEVHVQGHLGTGVERIDVTSQSGRTLVKVVLPHHSIFGDGNADLTVQVPRDSRIEVSSVSADVSVTGVTGALRLGSVSGAVSADIAGSDVDAKTVSGEVQLRGSSQLASRSGSRARLHLSTVSGDLRLTHGAGEIDARTVSGTLDVQADGAHAVRMRSTTGSVRFDGALLSGASLDAESLSGGLQVRARSESGYDYEASSFSGSIEDCFNVEATHTSRYTPGTRLSGTRGSGGGQITLKTLSGTVELCDH
jgi:DUF4097 and DUF4098 domain-containing protein YvlB